jgi:20S proteasome subunit beta 4
MGFPFFLLPMCLLTKWLLCLRYYCLSLLDKHHHPDITLGQGIKLMTMCIDELKRRLPIDFKGMTVKAIKADGIVDIEFDDDRIVKSA